MYLNSINYFRGIAIIWIVLPHCRRFSAIEYNTIFAQTIGNLIQGGSFLFIFISGFLFHHVFYSQFDFHSFFKRKLKFVLVPYLVMSIILMLIYILTNDLSPDKILYYFERIFYFLVTGKHLVPYWYIPFIMIVFVLSPLFVLFIKFPLKIQLFIILLLLTMPILIGRPLPSLFMAFNSVLYNSPVYLIGMVCSQRKETIYTNLIKKEYYLLGTIIILALIQTYLKAYGIFIEYGEVIESRKILMLQKIVFCIFFLVWLHRFEKSEFKFLNLLAANSFGIYFVHQFFIKGLFAAKGYFDFSVPPNSPTVYFLVTTLIITISLSSILILKKIVPKYSRYIVGS